MAEPRSRWAALAGRARAANGILVDAALAAAVAVPLSVPFFTDPPGRVTVLGGVLNAGTVIPLVWRRRWPFAVVAVVFTFAALVSLYHRPGQMLQYGGLVAIYTVADRGRRWQRAGFLWLILLTFPPSAILLKHNSAAEFMFTILLPLTAYLLGTFTRTDRARLSALADRAAELERGREADAARAIAEERTRIARDMHDVLAHAVAVMVVQAEAGPLVVRTDPDRATRAFDVIAEAGRSAMTQLSDTLGVLRGERDAGARAPAPTVAAIPELVNQVRGAGLRVALRVGGQPRPLAADADVAAYRIVQEALTNTLRHSRSGSAAVRLDWEDELRITVTDTGPGPALVADRAGAVAGGGRGLAGIRTRAEACGGRADAGPTPSGFRVHARLPITAAGG